MKKIGLYIHVPFCKSKCPYCDFYSMKSDICGYDEYTMYVLENLEKQVQEFKDVQADTLYFGGGTPSLLGAQNISLLAKRAKQLFGCADEITVECNPSAIEDDFFEIVSSSGINRISLGMQSAVDSERRKLGRTSDSAKVSERISQARKAGIENISLDVMLGIPGQSMDSLKETADFCLNSDVPHISAYMLKLEEGTYYYNNRDKLNLPDDDTVADMYIYFGELLEAGGFERYEISNFSKKGFESKHNTKYWNCDEYLGVGPSAHSFLNGRRFFYPRNLEYFISGGKPIDDGPGGDKVEYLMLRLRLKEGIIFDEYKSRYSEQFPQAVINAARRFESGGFVSITSHSISLTEKGFLVSNSIISELENEI